LRKVVMKNVRLPATMANLELLVRFVSEFLNANGFPGERIQEIEMAAEEVLVNIISYAYPEGGPGEVEIRGRADSEDELTLEFEDNGAPFDPTSSPQPALTLSLSDREVGGLGIFLVRKMVNEVRYRRKGDRNILTFLVRKQQSGLMK
jgi:serine/threonine-protein kinase RsbW